MTALFLIVGGTPIHAADAPKEDIKQEQPAAKAEEAPAKAEPAKTEEAAAPAAENPGRYADDFCDFEITFPEAPQLVEKCVPGAECYQLRSYTMVFGLQTTVDVSANCTPSTPENYKRYTEGVMKAALAGMVSNHDLRDYDVNFSEEKGYRTGALTGTGLKGASGMIYTGQLWVGPNSVFTVQAELIGDQQKVADEQFTDILKSIKFKGGKQEPKKPKPATKSKAKNQ